MRGEAEQPAADQHSKRAPWNLLASDPHQQPRSHRHGDTKRANDIGAGGEPQAEASREIGKRLLLIVEDRAHESCGRPECEEDRERIDLDTRGWLPERRMHA